MPTKAKEDLRAGAQVLVIMCGEPSGNTPGAHRRKAQFIAPLLEQHGVHVDHGKKGQPRWLMDCLKDFGIVRLLAEGDPITTAQLERSLNLAISAHDPEIIVLIEHTDCGERKHWYQQDQRFLELQEVEHLLIQESLTRAEAWIRAWHAKRGGVGELIIVKAVAVVTGGHAACSRRMEEILPLADYMDRFVHTARDNGTSPRIAPGP